jgi:hypothetical protein
MYERDLRVGVSAAEPRESIGSLLDAIGRFIDQTDPWMGGGSDRNHKVNTPESTDARRAFAELRKRLAGIN